MNSYVTISAGGVHTARICQNLQCNSFGADSSFEIVTTEDVAEEGGPPVPEKAAILKPDMGRSGERKKH